MRVRMIELRILGAALVGLWLLAFGVVLVGYRPGGPADVLVGIAAAPPALVATAALVWPPVARGGRAFALIAWLGLGAMLLLVPSLGGLLLQLRAGGPQTLLPSLEAAYPWLLALAATSTYTGLGIARHRLGDTALRRRRLALGTAIGVAFTFTAATAFGAAAIANELALRDRTLPASRYGPTYPGLAPPRCTDPVTAGPTALLTARLDMEVDGARTGTVTITGTRAGNDYRWLGFAATARTIGQYGSARIEGSAWDRAPRTGWVPVLPERTAGLDLDLQVLRTALTPDNRAVAEDRGISVFEGARARHCRVAVDGGTFADAFPEVSLLAGSANLDLLLGELDYWVFADGQLGRVEGRINGSAVGIVAGAILATVRAELTATDRGVAFDVPRPAG